MTIKSQIKDFLKERDWTGGIILEREVGELVGRKYSNISRRLREMVNEGTLEKRLTKVGSVRFVEYRLKEIQIIPRAQPRVNRLFNLTSYPL